MANKKRCWHTYQYMELTIFIITRDNPSRILNPMLSVINNKING